MKLRVADILEAARLAESTPRPKEVSALLVAEINVLSAGNLRDKFLWSAVFEYLAHDPVWKGWEEVDFPAEKILKTPPDAHGDDDVPFQNGRGFVPPSEFLM